MKKFGDRDQDGEFYRSEDVNKALDNLNKKIDDMREKNAIYSPTKQEGITPIPIDKNTTIMQKINKKLAGNKAIVINMELSSGDHSHFIAKIEDESFKWNGKTFVIDAALRYYDVNFKMWCLDYHEELSLPIARRINVNKVKKELYADPDQDIDMAFNPTTLRLFIESQVIQKVIKGADLDKVMEFIKRVQILTLVVVIATFLIILKGSGMLNNIHIPGFK